MYLVKSSLLTALPLWSLKIRALLKGREIKNKVWSSAAEFWSWLEPETPASLQPELTSKEQRVSGVRGDEVRHWSHLHLSDSHSSSFPQMHLLPAVSWLWAAWRMQWRKSISRKLWASACSKPAAREKGEASDPPTEAERLKTEPAFVCRLRDARVEVPSVEEAEEAFRASQNIKICQQTAKAEFCPGTSSTETVNGTEPLPVSHLTVYLLLVWMISLINHYFLVQLSLKLWWCWVSLRRPQPGRCRAPLKERWGHTSPSTRPLDSPKGQEQQSGILFLKHLSAGSWWAHLLVI